MVALLLGAAPQLAEACSCSEGSINRKTLPPDGGTEFPTDGTIRVFVWGAPRWMKVGLLDEYRLRGPQGLIPLEARAEDTMLSLRPKAPLSPHAEYALERVYAYDENGERLTDSQREKIARYGGEEYGPKNHIARRLWFPEARFRTGAGPERRTLAAPEIQKAEAYRDDRTSCGPGSSVQLEVRLPAGLLPTDVLGVLIEPSGVTYRTPAPTGESHKLWFGEGMCISDPLVLGFYEKMEARVFVLTAAGRRVVTPRAYSFGGPFELHGRDEPGSPDVLAWQQVQISQGEEHTSRAFFEAPIDGPPASRAVGPAECPHGLEQVESVDLPPGRLAWTAGDVASAGWRESKLYALYSDEKESRARVLVFAPSASPEGRFRFIEIPGRSDSAVAHFSDEHFAVASTVFESDDESQIRVAVLEYDGEARWSRVLGHPGIDWQPQIAEWKGRLLVAWARRDDQYRDQLSWAVLSTSDGTPTELRTRRGGGEARIAVGFGPGGLLLAWTERQERRETVTWAWVDDIGALKASPSGGPPVGRGDGSQPVAGSAPGGYELRVASDEAQPSLLFTNQDRVELLRLGSSARIPLSAGGQGVRHPGAVGSFALLYVAWAAAPTGGQITAIDRHGRVAPLTDISMGMTIPHIVVTPAGVWVLGQDVYDTHPVARRFHCRTEAPAKAPARLR